MESQPLPPSVGLIRNSGWNLLGQIIPVIAALCAMPVVVRGLGPTRFGILALAWTVVGYMSQFDLGFGRAAVKRVSELMWAGDRTQIARVSWTVAATMLGLGVASGVALFLGADPIARLMTSEEIAAAPEAARVIELLALAMPAVLVSNAYRAMLEGLQRFDLVNAARAPLSAAVFLIPLCGVLLNWSLATIVAVLAASRFAAALTYYVLFRSAGAHGKAAFDGAELRLLVRFGGWVALTNALVPLVIYLEKLVVSAMHGPKALAYYAAPQELVTRLLLVPAAVSAALFPAFSGLSGRGDDTTLLNAMRRGTRIIALLVAPASALLVLTAEPVIGIFFGAEYIDKSTIIMQVLACAVFLNALLFVPSALVEARGKPDVVAKYHMAELPVYAALLWLLVRNFGATGAALAWGCRMLWTTPLFYAVAVSSAGLSLSEPLRQRTAHTVGAGILLIACAAALTRVAQGPWTSLALGLLLVAAFLGAVWPLLLNDDDRAATRLLYARLRS